MRAFLDDMKISSLDGFRFRRADRRGQVSPVAKAFDLQDLANGSPAGRALDRDDQVDRLSDDFRHRLGADFGNELFKAGKSGAGRVRVNRRDAARMAGVPRLQESERRAVGPRPR